MERLLRLYFAQLLGGDLRDPMSVALGLLLEREVVRWVPTAPIATIPWYSMSKARAIGQACKLVAAAPETFLFAQRALAEPLDWKADVERRVVLGQAASVSEALASLDMTLASPTLFAGGPCRARFLQKRPCECQGSVDGLAMWIRGLDGTWRNVQTQESTAEGSAWGQCTVFASIPKSEFLVGCKGQTVLLGTLKTPSLSFATSVKHPDIVECEVVPSGTIVVTISRRNEDTGGCLQHETVAFRLNDSNMLDAVTLSEQEVKDADQQMQTRESSHMYDFSVVNSPLAAKIQSPWHSDIVLQEDIVFEDKGHGTVVGLVGHASDFWVAHATGLVIHVKNETIVDRKDFGVPLTHAVSFPASTPAHTS